MRTRFPRSIARADGQSMVELALVLPLLVALVLGIIELSYALLDAHVATRLSREGSNLISRDATLADAAQAMRTMATGAVNFDNGNSTVIFSVVKNVATVGASNYNQNVLYQRYQYGSFAATSAIGGPASTGVAPEYTAPNSDNDTSLRVTGLPPNITTLGSMVYITEIFTRHTLITPLQNLGINVPGSLYSIAYF